MAVVGLLIINVSLLAFLVLKKPPMPPQGPGPAMNREEGPGKLIQQRLHLDKEQVEAYQKLISSHQDSIRNLDQQISEAKNELYETLADSSLSNSAGLENKLAELQKRVESVHYRHFLELKAICRPEQIDDFNKLTKELASLFGRERNKKGQQFQP